MFCHPNREGFFQLTNEFVGSNRGLEAHENVYRIFNSMILMSLDLPRNLISIFGYA